MKTKKIINDSFVVSVRYEECDSKYYHRYYIECVDLKHWVIIYSSSNVIDSDKVYPIDEAADKVCNFFKIRFGVDLRDPKYCTNAL